MSIYSRNEKMAKNDSNAKHHEGWKTDERVKSIMPVTNWKV